MDQARHKTIAALLALVMFTAVFFGPSFPAFAADVTTGDLNFDGRITSADARIALRAAARLQDLSADGLRAGDVNGDGRITSADARKILRVAAKLEDFSTSGDSVPLPYGMRFGMTYDEVVATLRKNQIGIPTQEGRFLLDDVAGVDPSYLQSGTLNTMKKNGYLSYYTNWEPYGTDCRAPLWQFVFNDQGKLYGINFIKDFGTYLDDSFINEIVAYYTAFFGNDGTEDPFTEYSHGVSNVWRNDTVSVEYRGWKYKIMFGISGLA